jgi:hypothetical protein
MRTPMRTALGIGLRLAVSAAALWLAFTLATGFSGLDLAAPDPGWIAVAAGLHLSILAAITLRWRMLCGVVVPGPRPAFATLAAINWIGLGIGQIALGTLSGDAFRVVYLKRGGRSWGAAARSVLLDRLMGLVGLFAIAVCALWVALGIGFAAAAAGAVAAAGALGWAVLMLLRARLDSARLGGFRDALLADARRLAGCRAGWIGLVLTIAGHLMNVCVFYAVSRAFGLHPDLAATFVAVPGGIFGSVLPISLGGWGVRELSVAVLFDLVGTPFRDAVVASILFGLSHVAMGVPGLVFLLGKTGGTLGPFSSQTREDR